MTAGHKNDSQHQDVPSSKYSASWSYARWHVMQAVATAIAAVSFYFMAAIPLIRMNAAPNASEGVFSGIATTTFCLAILALALATAKARAWGSLACLAPIGFVISLLMFFTSAANAVLAREWRKRCNRGISPACYAPR